MIPIFALGNPGKEYEYTRHNAGFWVAQSLAIKSGFSFLLHPSAKYLFGKSSKFAVCLPLTYMNRSGDVIDMFYNEMQIEPSVKPIVIVDQMDLPPGELRLKNNGSTAGHNGLKSVYSYLGPEYFPLYLGIGRPDASNTVIDHVLGLPSQTELSLIQKAIDKAVAGLEIFAEAGPVKAMEFMNARTL